MERSVLSGPMWRWQGGNGAAWHFVTIGGEAGEALSATALMRRLESGRRAGFGSIKVVAQIGDSRFSTSVFPSRETGWMLPVKQSVRKAEDLAEGDLVDLVLEY